MPRAFCPPTSRLRPRIAVGLRSLLTASRQCSTFASRRLLVPPPTASLAGDRPAKQCQLPQTRSGRANSGSWETLSTGCSSRAATSARMQAGPDRRGASFFSSQSVPARASLAYLAVPCIISWYFYSKAARSGGLNDMVWWCGSPSARSPPEQEAAWSNNRLTQKA